GLILTRVSASSLLHDNLFPSAQLKAGSETVLKASAPMTASSFAKLLGHLVIYAAFCAGLVAVAAAIARGGWLRRLAPGALGPPGLAFLAVLAGDPEAIRSRLDNAYAWIPAGAALVALALAWGSRRGEWGAREQTVFLLAAALTV